MSDPFGRGPDQRRDELAHVLTDPANLAATSQFGVYVRRKTQLDIIQESPSFWRASFNNPPVNVFGAQIIIEMRALLDAAENDSELAVIVFESANPDYFIAHWDLADNLAALADQPPPVTGQQPFVDVLNVGPAPS